MFSWKTVWPLTPVVTGLMLFLSSCGSYGPFFNCRTGCVEPGYYRDMFCECQPPTSVHIPPAPYNPGDPYLFRQTIQGECTSFQEEDYIFNPRPTYVDVLVGFKVPPSGTWDEAWYTVQGNAQTTSSGYDLGRKYTCPDDFDRDFFIKTWSAHAAGTAMLAGAKMTIRAIGPQSSFEEIQQSLSPTAQERLKLMLARFNSSVESHLQSVAAAKVQSVAPAKDGTPPAKPDNSAIRMETKVVGRLDCAKVCQDGLDFRCFASTPPDGAKISKLRDRILSVRSNSTLPSADILKIFNMNSDPCSRGNTLVDAAQNVQNDGQICAYPILLQKTDTKPVAALHVGRNVNGYSIAGSGGVSIMFNKPMALPTLLFSQAAIEDDFGGKVLEVSADQNGVYFNTSAGMCVSLRVAP